MLRERLRQALVDQARTGTTTTYKELADRLGLEPPQTIHRLGEALETLMKDDVTANRPMLAALCVSKMWPGIPARGFFLAAKDMGVFSGDPTGPEARACNVCFHSMEARVRIWPVSTVRGRAAIGPESGVNRTYRTPRNQRVCPSHWQLSRHSCLWAAVDTSRLRSDRVLSERGN